MSLLRLEEVGFDYPGPVTVLTAVTVTVDQPQLIAIIGPNGAGKSTLLDVIAGHKTSTRGRCEVGGDDVRLLARDELCRRLAHVPQQVPADVAYSVEEVVLTGRIPYGRGLYESDEDYAAMEAAIAKTRLGAFRQRRFHSLSGGEKQRVLLAAALCQQTPILLLDEPNAHLDPENEAELWHLMQDLREEGRTVLVVTHHLALAAQHADRIWLLEQGRLKADAPPCEAMNPSLLEAVFHVPFHWHQNQEGRVFLTYGR